jgi:GT2 family glycosyltransferase
MAPVEIPWVDPPAVSILMVLYRGGVVALEALGSVAAHTTVPYEVVVVDNASPDASGAIVRMCTKGAVFVASPTNLGFGGGMNEAARHARAPLLCLLNPDVVVGPGWLEPLLAATERPGVAAVAPVLVYPDGSVQEAGSWIDSDGHTHAHTEPLPRTVDYASAACLVLRKEVFDELGGFDERYFPAYFEDADLGLRLQQAGWSTVVEPSVTVIHHRGGTDAGDGAKHLAHANHAVFVERWRDVLATKPSAVPATA